MDHESLRTAGTYLNNLLLARGLLRNGEPIDFVKPSKDSRAQIINLVHDLILRQDRDREQREQVALAIRQLRAEDTRKSSAIEKLTIKCDEAVREHTSAQAAARASATETKRAERTVKSLQEQLAKTKVQLAQVRTQCTNDVRKRDLELARLKTHLQGQQRGTKAALAAPSVTIVGGSSSARRSPGSKIPVHDLDDPEYSLRQETTEFLTQLSQSLSDENDGLSAIIRNTLHTMRDLLGSDANPRPVDSAMGSIASNSDGKMTDSRNSLHTLPASHETLATEMAALLENLKSILTNPTFVSVEEVEVRDEEIAHLREGWEHMEQRWRNVLLMMQGWLRRLDTGDIINIDDLRKGLGMVSPVRHMPPVVSRRRISDEGDQQEADNSLASVEEDAIAVPCTNLKESTSSRIAASRNPSSRASPKRKRNLLDPPDFFDLRPKRQNTSPDRVHVEHDSEVEDQMSSDDQDCQDEEDTNNAQPLTVAEKLAHAQNEADDINKKTKTDEDYEHISSSRRAHSPLPSTEQHSADPQMHLHGSSMRPSGKDDLREADDTLGEAKHKSPSVKRVNIRGRPRKKRKSTLTPEELELLIARAETDESQM